MSLLFLLTSSGLFFEFSNPSASDIGRNEVTGILIGLDTDYNNTRKGPEPYPPQDMGMDSRTFLNPNYWYEYIISTNSNLTNGLIRNKIDIYDTVSESTVSLFFLFQDRFL
jgi:hypothetical protein